ncbi:hypothetical protein Csp1_06270 [Corynebacterium provencense]|uniref:MobA-like NTP transferase domain-containing protein n=1 Tax=Corynebacterium provencense TaxID=1737425 RepID=A0A2Z3YNN7_9CORY|nr:NTP transferase domain-containing protein [Corynebacterium provencense]AWT25439.1 hypothetical protein Csp1_06270 [Corynebacterium provencense]
MFAVIVAGGTGERLRASAPAPVPVKPLLEDATGRRLIDRVLDACTSCRGRIVVSGPVPLPADVTLVREDPPLAGPAAGIAAGVGALPPDFTGDVIVLPADLARPEAVVAGLTGPGVVSADGHLQPLIFRAPAGQLRAACSGNLVDAPVMRIIRALDLPVIRMSAATVADVDTWEDALEHGFTHRRTHGHTPGKEG